MDLSLPGRRVCLLLLLLCALRFRDEREVFEEDAIRLA